jgi:hypothetical protein
MTFLLPTKILIATFIKMVFAQNAPPELTWIQLQEGACKWIQIADHGRNQAFALAATMDFSLSTKENAD